MESPVNTLHHCLAPAKLNLFLHINGQRKDGYHELQTVFQLTNWGDFLNFTCRKDHQILRKNALPFLSENQDLTLRAAHLLRDYVQQPELGVEIENQKNIPLGAGLGGGSSDAATTLLALNHLWHLDLKRETLQNLALQLGADVPFFIFGQNAFAQGVGEQLQAIELPHRYFIIVRPNAHISTAQIFSDKQLTRDTKKIKIHDFLTRQNLSHHWPDDFGQNDMQHVVVRNCEAVAQVLDWFTNRAPARMTGSGACVFSYFRKQAERDRILAELPKKWQAYATESVNRHPLFAFAK